MNYNLRLGQSVVNFTHRLHVIGISSLISRNALLFQTLFVRDIVKHLAQAQHHSSKCPPYSALYEASRFSSRPRLVSKCSHFTHQISNFEARGGRDEVKHRDASENSHTVDPQDSLKAPRGVSRGPHTANTVITIIPLNRVGLQLHSNIFLEILQQLTSMSQYWYTRYQPTSVHLRQCDREIVMIRASLLTCLQQIDRQECDQQLTRDFMD